MTKSIRKLVFRSETLRVLANYADLARVRGGDVAAPLQSTETGINCPVQLVVAAGGPK
jgi:hypothetical protein